MKHVIIYVPGLGDGVVWLVWLQKIALQFWRVRGFKVEVVKMGWSDPIPLKPRFERLVKKIDTLHSEGRKVFLIGTSAGASAAISALAERPDKVSAIATICGKIQGSIPDSVKELNPSFAESLTQLQEVMKTLQPELKQKILTIYSPLDAVVPAQQAVIPGAQKLATRALGHNPTCAYVLLFQAKKVTHFFKQLTDI